MASSNLKRREAPQHRTAPRGRQGEPSYTMSCYVPGRPLVVIAGWLGCQPRSLRRYEALYRKLGFGVVTRIATPRMVAKSSTQTPPCIKVPAGWPDEQQKSLGTMQDLAWDALREVHASQCSVVFFHGFSNGGGFFWEQVRNILFCSEVNANVSAELETIRSKVVGAVFDSCPAKYSPTHRNTFLDALNHCTWTERIGAYAQLAKQYTTYSLAESEQRSMDYFLSMRNDPWNVRQLYLFSKDDPLSPHDAIEELVRHRQGVFGKDKILLCEWDSSPHCCHLLQHPIEYQVAVSAFVEQCLHGDTVQQSKL